MLDWAAEWLSDGLTAFSTIWPERSFLSEPINLHSMLATVLVCFICGAVGSLVIGNRMAFFSDALAHCAFAGAGLGLMFGLLSGTRQDVLTWWLPLIMVGFGVVFGLGIAFVREKTGLANDTVIGVFFAGA